MEVSVAEIEKTAAEVTVEWPPLVMREPEKPRLAWWKMPPVGRETVSRLRDILGLSEEDELPEAVCLLLGLRSAIDATYSSGEVPHSSLVDLVLQAHLMPLFVEPPLVTPGSKVVIKSQNLEAVYVLAGPFGRHLVNRFGVWFLLAPEDLAGASPE